jgi:hypothetical protein
MFQGLGVEVKTRTMETTGIRHPADGLVNDDDPNY